VSKIKEIDIEITNIAYGGKGVGRYDGKVVFVPHVLSGELVRVQLLKEHPKYINAQLVTIIEPSPERIESDCLVFVGRDVMGKKCFAPTPGCVYQTFSYQEELRVKNIQFSEFLNDCTTIVPSTPSPEQKHYRNKIIFHTMDDHGDIALGYCAEKGHEVLDMPECPLAISEINNTLSEIRNKQGFKQSIRDGMSVTFRYTENDGVIWWRNAPSANASWIKETTVLGKISVPLGSFFQVNNAVADILIDKVIQVLKECNPDSVIDLYCGCGLFSVAAAEAGVARISGLDCDVNSIAAAKYNAKNYGMADAVFSPAFADKGLSLFIEEHIQRTNTTLQETVLILDPPRGGIGRNVRELLKDTLQRDLQIFYNAGYTVLSAEMLDMFPRTSHFESMIVLSK